jgi:hypothetical protein
MWVLRAYYRGIVLLAFVLSASVAVAGNSLPVSADPCVVQLGYSSLSTTQYYYNMNVGLTVPVSASCSLVGGQLYAVGDAYDTTANTDLGSVSTALTPVYGSSTFNGQLVFSLPSSILGHPVRISVSIYNGAPYGYYGYGGNGSPLAVAAQMVQLNLRNYQNSYYYQNGNCYRNPYCYYPGYYFNGNYYTTCRSIGNGNTVQCSGYLYQPSNGCVQLAIPIDNGYWFESRVYQYYALQNLPFSYAPTSGWVTVTGQLYQGYNFSPSGSSCPGNYIVVNSISP